VNNNTLHYLKTRYPNEVHKFGFLPTWVDESPFCSRGGESDKRDERQAFNVTRDLPIDGPWFVFVGRFQEVKDPIFLLHAFAEIKRQLPDAILVLVGDGNLKEKMLETTNALGLSGSVHFVGVLSQPEVATLYRAADLFLMTSHNEGMPRSPLEAIGCGLPVVTTKAGEVERFVHSGETGEVVLTRDPVAFAAVAVAAYQDRARYLPGALAKAVASYRPQLVLRTLYEKIAALSELA
jgi:glycosyltransferase involved in cell wall biosynthesis